MQSILVKHFRDLSPFELYDILQLREEVFQLEQTCLYKDIDDKDKYCHHLLLYKNEILVAYCRLVPTQISYHDYVSIGRVVSKQTHRKTGYGRLLMDYAMQQMDILFPQQSIKISAQQYLQKFYESYGFVKVGEWYMEDDIPHISMVFTK